MDHCLLDRIVALACYSFPALETRYCFDHSPYITCRDLWLFTTKTSHNLQFFYLALFHLEALN